MHTYSVPLNLISREPHNDAYWLTLSNVAMEISCLQGCMGIQSTHGSRPVIPFWKNIMRPTTKVTAHTTDKVSEFALSRQAQAQALDQADRVRAEQRSVNDARIDSNASKWRYTAAVERV